MRFALVLLLLIPFSMTDAFAQSGGDRHTTYLDATFQETVKRKAFFVRTLNTINDSLLEAKVVECESTKLKMKGTFLLRQQQLMEHGHFIFYYPNGQIESEGMYEYGYKMGAWKRFTAQGDQRPDRFYKAERSEMLRALEQ